MVLIQHVTRLGMAKTGTCEKFGRTTARSHSRLCKFFRNKELFPSHEGKRVVFRIFFSFQSPFFNKLLGFFGRQLEVDQLATESAGLPKAEGNAH